jgi:hypothetical protein
MAKPKGAVSGHRTLAGQNLADAIGWHINLPGETRRRYPLSSSSSLKTSPGCTARCNIVASTPSVIVHNLNV